ncbi:hypothetical protein [Mycolicibacterium brumae]|uniref:Uncharacterized protein n=1 Tax=Mycolicibacterium brumae TaxID=85968 RepID=A0A2G5PDS1_9MYCO|nr:hypothetical protein [Mycolicibacterium brumae]MCV7193604.1 hypothetical protein [Mycolicibacterium brumae]PIB76173.1 hypothetical protein CQY22_007300 [Mycolicibacterium brumae]RWA17303.1 hypothetical protein MBRU_06675 [Mycolicibacterium brumae DSM 44177]UWW09123.1 hypothetical protein L2Z93_002208 [Mycolicibacterium brumae]
MRTRPLRIALHTEPEGWVELTNSAADPGEITRLRVGALSDAARLAAASARPAFVDVDVVLADSVNQAFLEFTELHPQWSPGARADALAHPGTSATLAGLLWDIWAARVADGVTLRSADPEQLLRRIVDEVIPLLESRGLPLELGARAS